MGGAPSLILPNLWLGGQDVINDASFFESRNVGYVLSLGPAAPPARIAFAGREHINIPDIPTADLSRHLSRAARFIAEGRHVHNRCVYVHCAAGISRSTTCLCAYLMAHLDLSFREALSFVSSKRRAVCPNEGFTRQLKRFEMSKERTDLAEEFANTGGSGYAELRSRDLKELHRGPTAKPEGCGPRSAPPCRGRRSSHGGGVRPAPLSSVEQEAQQNALQAVRGAISQHHAARAEFARRRSHEDKTEALRVGNGDAKGDVGLGWLLRPLADNAGTPAAGRPSGPSAAARHGWPQQQPNALGARRSSYSQPAGARRARPPSVRR